MKGWCTWACALLMMGAASGVIASSPISLPQWPASQPWPEHALIVLAYHDVRADADQGKDPDAITPDALIRQWEWLQGHGYQAVSWSAVQAARAGGPALPPKAVLLTFDDGLKSAYTTVFPLLKAYRMPAVMAVVDAWINQPVGTTFSYNGRTCGAECFISWDEARTMDQSGWVTIGSHSDDLHHGLQATPQGSLWPAAMNHLYDAKAQRYESDDAYRQRIQADLAQSQATLTHALGHPVTVIAWPYGAYNAHQVAWAHAQGMESLGLSASGPVDAQSPVLERVLVGNDLNMDDFVRVMGPPARDPMVRAVVLSLRELDGPTLADRDARLGQWLDRIKTLAPTEVWLTDWDDRGPQMGAHGEGHGDVWGRTVWQLRTRASVRVAAVMPAETSLAALERLGQYAPIDSLVLVGSPSVAAQQAARTALWRARPAARLRVWSTAPVPLAPDTKAVCSVTRAGPEAACATPQTIRIVTDAPQPDPARFQALLAQGNDRWGWVWSNALEDPRWRAWGPIIRQWAAPQERLTP